MDVRARISRGIGVFCFFRVFFRGCRPTHHETRLENSNFRKFPKFSNLIIICSRDRALLRFSGSSVPLPPFSAASSTCSPHRDKAYLFPDAHGQRARGVRRRAPNQRPRERYNGGRNLTFRRSQRSSPRGGCNMGIFLFSARDPHAGRLRVL